MQENRLEDGGGLEKWVLSSQHEERDGTSCRRYGRRISPESHLEVCGGETLNSDFRLTAARKTTKSRLRGVRVINSMGERRVAVVASRRPLFRHGSVYV